MGNLSAIVAVLLYVIAILFALAAALVTYVVYSLGLARICKKLDACHPILAWIPLVQSVVIARTGDVASLKTEHKKRSLTKQAVVSFILMIVAYLALLLCAVVGMLLAMWSAPDLLMYILLAAVVLIILVLFAFAVWFDVVWYIGFFRTARAFVPTWASWLLLVALLLWPQFNGAILLILSFFSVKQPQDWVYEQEVVE